MSKFTLTAPNRKLTPDLDLSGSTVHSGHHLDAFNLNTTAKFLFAGQLGISPGEGRVVGGWMTGVTEGLRKLEDVEADEKEL